MPVGSKGSDEVPPLLPSVCFSFDSSLGVIETVLLGSKHWIYILVFFFLVGLRMRWVNLLLALHQYIFMTVFKWDCFQTDIFQMS